MRLISPKMLFIMLLIFSVSAVAEAEGFKISGRVFYPKEGTVYLMLSDRASSKNDDEGIAELILAPSGKGEGFMEFLFTGIPVGTYGLRCFQDENGNGELDMGFFGPREPWGMSWSDGRRIPPDFDDYSFVLESDLDLGDVVLGR